MRGWWAWTATAVIASEFADLYVNTSQGDGDVRGSWNSDDNFNLVSDREQFLAMDSGDGLASTKLSAKEKSTLQAMAKRTRSNPDLDPETGAELGMGGNGNPRLPRQPSPPSSSKRH
ncbi:MAG: hypothetical protein ACREPV_10440 [Lysobacter sp.]